MDAGARFLARERGAFDLELPPERTHKPDATAGATAELQDFLTEDEQRWMRELFARLAK